MVPSIFEGACHWLDHHWAGKQLVNMHGIMDFGIPGTAEYSRVPVHHEVDCSGSSHPKAD
jgi:hypothetical protein